MTRLARIIALHSKPPTMQQQVAESRAELTRLRRVEEQVHARWREAKDRYRAHEAKHRNLERAAYGLPTEEAQSNAPQAR